MNNRKVLGALSLFLGIGMLLSSHAGIFKGVNYTITLPVNVEEYLQKQPIGVKNAFQMAFSNFTIIGYSAHQRKNEHGYYRQEKVGTYTIGYDKQVAFKLSNNRWTWEIRKGNKPFIKVGVLKYIPKKTVGVLCISLAKDFSARCPKFKPVPPAPRVYGVNTVRQHRIDRYRK